MSDEYEREPWLLSEQRLVLEGVPPALARVFEAHLFTTWADVEQGLTEAQLLSYPGIGRDALRWLRYEIACRRGAVRWTATGNTTVPLWAKLPLADMAPDHSGVYFIQCGPFVKIGCARSIRRRFQSLQQNIPFRLTLVGVVEAPIERLLEVERSYHARFASAHQVAEWFRLEGELDTFCLELARVEQEVPA